MVKIGLDLAAKTCGIAVLYEDKLFYDSLVIKEKASAINIQCIMVNWIIQNISLHFDTHNVKIYLEDIFKGDFKTLVKIARTQGAVVDRLVELKCEPPEYITAVAARNKVGLNPQCPKAGIQVFVLNTFKLWPKEHTLDIDRIQSRVDRYLSLVNSKDKKDKYPRWRVEEELDKYSLLIAKETGIDEHKADAIVLAMGG